MSRSDIGKNGLPLADQPDPSILRVIGGEIVNRHGSLAKIVTEFVSSPLMIFFSLGCIFSILPLINSVLYSHENKDYTHWYVIGSSVQARESLYADAKTGEPGYLYPPTAAVLLYAPLSNLNPVCFVAVLCLFSTAAWVFSVWASTVITTGSWSNQTWHTTILPGLAVAPYVWDIQFLGQTNLLLLALTLGAFLCFRNQRLTAAGTLFGTAVALKAFPLPAIAYFIVRRSWYAAMTSIMTVIALIWFFPGIIRGFERNAMEVKQWATLMILDQSGESMAGRSSIGFTRRNQSLVSVSHRLLRPINAGDNPDNPLYVNLANASPRTAQLVGYGACLLLGFVLLIACRFCFGRTRECEGLEMAMVCTLVPLCSPLAWTYFFCWLLPGWTALGHWWNHPTLTTNVRRTAKLGTVMTAVLLASATSEQVDPTLQAYGMTAWGSVILFLTLAYLRFHLPRGEGAETKFSETILQPQT